MSATSGALSGRRILLTGASGGLGRALAERLRLAGAELALTGRKRQPLARLAEKLGVEAEPGDLTDSSFLQRLAAFLEELWGGAPDVLVNNAGAFELADLVDTEPERFANILAVNLQAPFELARIWLPEMLSRGAGHIVNIGSVAGRWAFPGNAAYSASKFGLRGLHEVLVEELHATGVRVTWIEPSAVDTPLWDRFEPDRRPDLPARSAMLRPDAVAEAVFFAIAQPEDVSIEEIVIRSNAATGER